MFDQSQVIEHVSQTVQYSPFDVRWIPRTSKLIAAGETPKGAGCIQVYELNEKNMALLQTNSCKAGVKTTIIIGGVGSQFGLATADFAGTLAVYDIQTMTPTWTVPAAHAKLINKIDACGGGDLSEGPVEIATASRDGKLKVWDPRVTDPIVMLDPGGSDVDCWCTCFGNAFNSTDRCVAAGYDNGDIKLLDLRTMTLRWEHNVKNGVCHLAFDRKSISMNKLSVSCLEAQLHVFDMRTYNVDLGYSGLCETVGKSTVWGCHYLPQDRDIFGVTTGEGSLSIYKYEYPLQRSVNDTQGLPRGVPGTLSLLSRHDTLSTQPIVALAWHPDRKGLGITASVDQCLRSIIVTKI